MQGLGKTERGEQGRDIDLTSLRSTMPASGPLQVSAPKKTEKTVWKERGGDGGEAESELGHPSTPEHNKDLFHPCPTHPPSTQDLSDSSQRRLSDGCESAQQPDEEKTQTVKERWYPPQDKLMMIQQYDAVDVTLDAYTASNRLWVSENGKQLSFRQGQLFSSALWYMRKFDHQPYVLGKDGFSSGRFYYEVRVSGSTGWVLGVVKESINLQTFLYPTPEEGGWAFGGLYNESPEIYLADIANYVTLYMRQRPQTVGVFVDYEKGEVSFYDVDTRTLIYSYTGCAFTETPSLLNVFLHYLLGIPVPI
ncbi:E3 ubiquitin-protein ligase TRIM39-like protein, partial [Lates japonicus]